MKKLLLTSLSALGLSVLSFAQAVLPTSYDWATGTPLPTGWSGISATYAGSGNPAPAGKFAATGDKLTINFTSTPGTLQYDLVGNPPPAGTWAGTFTVEESVNGTTWTTVSAYTTLPATYTHYTATLNGSSRYARFNFTTHTTGNVGIDNVNISAGVSTTQQINVKQGTTTIVNGGTYALSSPVSTMTPTTFTIQNLGTVGTLNISGVTITGPAAADYSVASFPATVAPSGSGNMVINFTPSVSGTRMAAINIANNDPTAATYVINMYGVGGTLASQPTAQATGLSFTNVKSYRYNGSFTAASPAPDGGYLVLRKKGSAVTDVPVDGTVYQRGDVIGTSKVAYSSSATAFFPTSDVIANTTYFYAVYAYNGPGIYRNYLNTSPLTGSVTTSGSGQPATYYNTSTTTSPTFVADLHNKINAHTLQFYGSYGPLMVADFFARDTTGNQRVVTCVYSGENKVYSDPFDWTTTGYSREHTYCQSWMPTVNDPAFQNRPEYNDYHMITPTNQPQVNAVRSNYPLGEVVGTPISTYMGSKLGYDIHGNKVFEPRNSDKGDAARCMMYQTVCYTGVAYTGPPNTNVTYGGSWSVPNYISSAIPYGQDQNVLKKWHYQDPPDNLEIARNDYVDSLQGNRNPFIDSVQFACYINFMNMTKINSPLVPCNNTAIGIAEHDNNSDMIMLAPNPSDGNFTVTYITDKEQKVNIRLFDMVGRVIYSSTAKVNNGYNPIEMNIENLSKGIYTFEFTTEKGRTTEKLVIE